MADMKAIASMLAQPVEGQDVVNQALRTMRTHLGMEFAYLSEFVDDHIIFRAVDAPGLEHMAPTGSSRALEDTYCIHVASGALPMLIPDTHQNPVAVNLKVTHDIPIRAHVSVPIERRDGSLYGMFCCLSTAPNPTLNDRDLDLMRTFARLAQGEVQNTLEHAAAHSAIAGEIEQTILENRFDMAFQPIFELTHMVPIAIEGLCRFKGQPYRPPNFWFDDAARVGLARELELAVISYALKSLAQVPDSVYMSLNASADTIASGELAASLPAALAPRLAIEVTEHDEVSDWAAFSRQLSALRDLGARIAIDDAGAGYSGLQQMIRLRPDIIKLDRSLVAGIDTDRVRRSLCTAMIHYARETKATLVAEGIETETELSTLIELGVGFGQGYHLTRPKPLNEVLPILTGDRSARDH